MEADKALERIGHDTGEDREQGPDHGKRADSCSQQLGAWCNGYMPYHHAPSPAPSGKAAIAACCASMFATTLPSVTMPGVACLTQSAPMPAAIDPVAISAVAARVPA